MYLHLGFSQAWQLSYYSALTFLYEDLYVQYIKKGGGQFKYLILILKKAQTI
jgi:hypothetical protein